MQWLIARSESQRNSENCRVRRRRGEQGAKRISFHRNSSSSRQERRKCEATTKSPFKRKYGQTLVSSYENSFHKKTVIVRTIFGHDLLTIWSPPHCLTQPKVGEQSAFPSLTTASFAATGDFPFVDGKTHCALNHGTH